MFSLMFKSKKTKGVEMSKKLVASLIGWLILVLFLTSSVWAAANKDKKPVANKQFQAPSATSVAPSSGKSMEATIKEKFFAGQMLSLEEKVRAMGNAKSSESRDASSVYEAVTGVISESPFFSPGVLTETAPENYDTAGNTYYGINSNHRNQRQIAIPKTNTNVGMAWTKSNEIAITNRNVMGTLWKNSSKVGGNFLTNIPLNGDLGGRTGFAGMTYLPKSGRLVIYGHHAGTNAGRRGTYFGAETAAGQFDWGSDTNAPDSIAGDADPGIWPTAAGGLRPDVGDFDGDGNAAESVEVIHFFSNEGNTSGGSVDHYIYSRGTDSAGVWTFRGFTGIIGALVDTGIGISPTVVASKKSSRVALIYTTERQCGFSPVNCSDVYYIESMNGGNDWATASFNFSGFPATNITNYDSSSTVRATSDQMGVYDNNDSLVIAYTQLTSYDIVTGSESYDADIIVWTKQWGNRKAADGAFTTTGTHMPQSGFRKSLNFPMIGVHDGTGTIGRNNYLYLTY